MANNSNFATWNSNAKGTNMSQGTFSNGNLTYAASGDDGYFTTAKLSHKCYCELRVDSLGNYGGTLGIVSNMARKNYDSVTFQFNYQSGVIYHYKDGSQQSNRGNIGGTVSSGSILMMAYDPDSFKWWVGVNGTWRNSGNPAAGSGQVDTLTSVFGPQRTEHLMWGGWKGGANGFTGTFNFGQDSTFAGQETAGSYTDSNGFGEFKYQPPTGFLANCSGNLPLGNSYGTVNANVDPVQTNDDYLGGKHFNVITYTGNAGSNAITGLGFQPDFCWIKKTNSTGGAALVSTIRGGQKVIQSNSDSAEGSSSPFQTFDTDGFTLDGTSSYLGNFNGNSDTYVAWCWRGNGGASTATNNNGTITSYVQANQDAGFSMGYYAGTLSGSGTGTVGHGLSKAPDFIITKSYDQQTQWCVQHVGLSSGAHVLFLEQTASESDKTGNGTLNTPTSTVFTTNYTNGLNEATDDFIFYAWHAVEGFSSFGKYVGNGQTTGTYVHTGFRPRLLCLRRIDGSGSWLVSDSERRPNNDGTYREVYWNQTSSEQTGTHTHDGVDYFSDGFRLRATNAGANGNGNEYIYMAWGDAPFRYPATF